MDGLAKAAGHQDRQEPLKDYCKGLLLPGERKSIEPMAARLDPDNVQALRQSLHHLVAKAPWGCLTELGRSENRALIVWRRGAEVDGLLEHYCAIMLYDPWSARAACAAQAG